tara:strand:+ start:472 stop:642 length:171 start_codon:yes stop_codon:yes gene_type:complete
MIENNNEVCALLKAMYVVPKVDLDVAENNNVRNNYAVSQADMALINAVPVLEPYDY